MSHRYFIVAGTHAEYQSWVKSNVYRFPHTTEFMWVHGPIIFRGYANPHRFFVGTFRSRADLYEIVTTIIMCSHDMSLQTKTDLIHRVLPPAYIAP